MNNPVGFYRRVDLVAVFGRPAGHWHEPAPAHWRTLSVDVVPLHAGIPELVVGPVTVDRCRLFVADTDGACCYCGGAEDGHSDRARA